MELQSIGIEKTNGGKACHTIILYNKKADGQVLEALEVRYKMFESTWVLPKWARAPCASGEG